ncbi:MAG: hypothetical protein KC593_21970 [Myxococcales bacterium]|nr:hypothetical protein [Myxococcales bacterium]MCB9625957.1 hypothetical protein [Sandaracinaceae bacterium]
MKEPFHFAWSQRYATPPSHLVVAGEELRLTRGERVQTVSLAAFATGALHEEVLAAFDFQTLVEALALALPDAAPLRRDGAPEGERGRSSTPRVFGGGRGSSGVVFILGRRVSGHALEHRFDLSFEEFLRDGLLPAAASAIGADDLEKVRSAVRQLSALDCMCDTGCETPEQHGGLVSLIRRDHPAATVDFNVTVARCQVCGGLWSFQSVGDSHYSYEYTVRRVVSVPAAALRGACASDGA